MERGILFDDGVRGAFLPFTFYRPLSELRFGIMTVREKWELRTELPFSWLTLPHLREKYPIEAEGDALLLNGALCPDDELMDAIEDLDIGEALLFGDRLLAMKVKIGELEELCRKYDEIGAKGLLDYGDAERVPYSGDPLLLSRRWELFTRNEEALRRDHELLKAERPSAPLSSGNDLIGDELFLGKDVKLSHVTLNTETGPIHIDDGAEVMEGATIRGPFYLGPDAKVKMGAKIYGPTTVGPYAKVGGEINNSVIFGYSNKAHDGFLGNSVIGEWCNLGADTNNSNLKNNYGPVKVWDYEQEGYMDSGLTFCGIFMGDHSKCGIDTMFNTGTTVGFSANVFDAGFPPKFVPSFFWGGKDKGEPFDPDKAKEVAEKIRARRELPFDGVEERLFDAIHEMTRAERDRVL